MDSYTSQEPAARPRLAETYTITTPEGEWDTPTIGHVSLGLRLSNVSGKWQGKSGLMSADFIAGDVAICEYGRSRTLVFDRPADAGVIVLSDALMREVSQETRYPVPEIPTVQRLQDMQLTRLAQILVDEGRNNFGNGSLFSDSVATALAQYLWNRYSASPQSARESAGGMAPSLLRKSTEYIRAHLDRDVRLEDLAREAGLSRSHYIRSFRQSMGITPHQYLLAQRVKHAQQLMRQSMNPLADIALSCGFSDQHHLARIFRRFTGMTPKMFRRSL